MLKDSIIEWKIVPLFGEYSLEYWEQAGLHPQEYTTSSEVTYHSSKVKVGKVLPGIVHLKEVEGDQVNYKYKFHKVTDVPMDAEFPLPLFKLAIKEDERVEHGNRVFVTKKAHTVFDFNDPEICHPNTLDVYAVSKDFDENKFSEKWANISTLWVLSSIDYVTKGVHLDQQFRDIMTSGKPGLAVERHDLGQFCLILRPYRDKDVKTNRISFYENYDYISMLGASIQLIDDKTRSPLSQTKPAFYFDLKRQREKNMSSKEEIELWNKFFCDSYERISKLGLQRVVFQIPQV